MSHIYTPDDYQPRERNRILRRMEPGEETLWAVLPNQTWPSVRSSAYGLNRHGRLYRSQKKSANVVAVVRVS